ncbi:MAG TPA: sugar ABC transporter ATP-binding protein [Chthoniobacterales bacterium]|nr:sugar ABC transporter ATP-binding protein [Chthoniobacterales bacterium]
MPDPILELSGIHKRFPGVVALSKVDFSVYPAEVVALIGENGAGKSTLMKILGGIYQADEGNIRLYGREVQIRHVADARYLGISLIHQELSNLDNLDVGGNIFLGREPLFGGPLRFVDRNSIADQSKKYLEKVGLNISPRTPLSGLSIAQQQLVEIAKALSTNAKIIVMDEPTSCLTLIETNRLLKLIAELKSAGVSVIFISHRLMEVASCADRVVGLRDGRNSGQLAKSEINHDNMVRLMVGRNLDLKRTETRLGDPKSRIEFRNIVSPFFPTHSVSFDLRRGEILGLAGLVGAGRSELAMTVFGIARPLGGEVVIDGEPIKIHSPRDAINHGIYLVPEDRRKTGLITSMAVRENVTLPALRNYSTLGLISYRRETETADAQRTRLSIRTASCETLAKNLSGGNQQKVVLAKWLSLSPKLIIFDEPTRGVDVGSKAEIYRLMRGLADHGVFILMISSDMEEVLGVSDRIAVMREGALTGVLDAKDFNEEAIMRLAVAPVKTAEA